MHFRILLTNFITVFFTSKNIKQTKIKPQITKHQECFPCPAYCKERGEVVWCDVWCCF